MQSSKFTGDNLKNQTQDSNGTKGEQQKEAQQKGVGKETEELKKRIEELENNWKRALADYQNLEKRAKEEKKNWIITSNKELILRLLPVLDTLILAEKHSKNNNQGLSLSIKQFLGILKDEGVNKIDTVGKKFDPVFMECIETIEEEEGKVLEEIRPGYSINEKVLRAALVKVGKEKIGEKKT